MSYINEVNRILEKISQKKESLRMAGNTFFLDEDYILNYPREDGDNRYPIDNDGYTLWAHSSGYMYAREGRFYSLSLRQDGDDPDIDFFASVVTETGENEYFSLLGIPVEANNKCIERFSVFSSKAAYYFTKFKDVLFCVRAFVGKRNELFFSVLIKNGETQKKILVSEYINPFLRCSRLRDYDLRWFRESRIKENDSNNMKSGIVLTNEKIYAIIHSNYEGQVYFEDYTASRDDYVGGKSRGLSANSSLINGSFKKSVSKCSNTHDSVYGNILKFVINPTETARIDTRMTHYSKELPEIELSYMLKDEDVDKQLLKLIDERTTTDQLDIVFSNSELESLDSEKLNNFIAMLKRQTEFCTFSKYYGWSEQLGIRDVFQQMEPTTFWKSEEVKKVIIDSLSYIESNGRAPRQYAKPLLGYAEDVDLRKYIDQGVWIISSLYTFFSYTHDREFLFEECPYREYPQNNSKNATVSVEKGTVLDHLIRIQNYLISCKDEDTDCIRILHGDWNDALSGMGSTIKSNQEFGNGVSVMATLQVYRNLGEMLEILEYIDSEKYSNIISRYKVERVALKNGLIKNALLYSETEGYRIAHGWGEDKKYFVGSYNDGDNKSRISLTANAFWILCDMLEDENEEIRADIINNIVRTDSKYGFKTFNEPFDTTFDQLSNITTQDSGTLENACAYVHASAFATMALFKAGEPAKAWEQMYKIMPITHNFTSHSPYVMPNAYMENQELYIDGESVNDWMTGSAPVMLKIFIQEIIGFNVTISGITIRPAEYLPFKKLEFFLKNDKYDLHLTIRKEDQSERKYFINGKEVLDKIFIPFPEKYQTYKIDVII